MADQRGRVSALDDFAVHQAPELVARSANMLNDIRDTSDEQYWEDLRKRWTSLLSYRYIGRNHGALNAGPVDNTVALRHDMRNAAGGIMVAPLCISAPESGGFSDASAVPARSSSRRKFSTTPRTCGG
jgi:hypothetical protein